ncbi:MFS transporter [Aeromonas hydrophila]|uniref:MFS transporter n=1 Tax=Aeromonas hydrophila TaxID=644 RepID=UPI003F7B0F42
MSIYQKYKDGCEYSHINKRKNKTLVDWNPDDKCFWVENGSHIARRNLLVSIPCLLISFSVWMIFSVVAMNLPLAGFNFTTDQLFLLTALPSLSGALGRIPYSFVIPVFGGRRWTAFSTLLLMIPMSWLAIAVQDTSTQYSTFLIISLLCGFGGANFASSMANISLFYPKTQQGKALGLNGGLGNLGVSVMQILVPIVISINIFGPFGLGQGNPDASIWLSNAALVWIPIILILSITAWHFMNDITAPKASFKEQWAILKQKHLWIIVFCI